MILYFSATGNSDHVARRIAAATDDKVMSIERFDAEILHLAVMEGPRRLGFVAPVYAWGLPTPMIEFLKTVDLSVAAGTKGGERPYTFYVSTYGSTTGQSAKFARDLLHERGLELDAAMSVKMPDTWTPVFDLSDPQKVEGINRAAEAQIDAVIEAGAPHGQHDAPSRASVCIVRVSRNWAAAHATDEQVCCRCRSLHRLRTVCQALLHGGD